MIFKRSISFLLIAYLLAGCATGHRDANVETGPGAHNKETPGLNKRDQKEIDAGREIHREILSTFSQYTELESNSYVKEITQNIAKVSQRRTLPYQCTILYSDKIYATSAPGGHVYLTTGFINFLENEAELAGVIAHEIAELQYLNPKYSPGKQVLQAAMPVVGVAGSFLGGIGALALLGLTAVSVMTDEKSPEQRVQMADKKTLQYMNKAGYDPQGWLDVLHKIFYAEDSLMPYLVDYYTSRPVNAKRMKRIQTAFRKLDLENRDFDTHREKFLNMTSGIKQIYLDQSR